MPAPQSLQLLKKGVVIYMKKVLKLFQYFICHSKLNLSRGMEYRLDFILGSIMNLIFSCVGPVFQYLIFTQTKGFPGWNLQQIILFQGVLLFVLGLKNTIWGELPHYVVSLVRRGDLDRLLLKPLPSIGIILTSGFSANNFGTIISGIILIIYSISKLKLHLGLLNIILFFIFILFGLLLFMAMNILFTSTVVMLTNIGRLNEIIENLSRFGQYPLEIYSNVLRAIFMTIIPFAIWIYIPSKILMDCFNVTMLYSSIFCILFTLLSLKLWSRCIKHYTSGGG